MKIRILFFSISCFLTSIVFGQKKYIQTSQGLVDSTTYEILKAKKIEKIKSILPSKDNIVTINDTFNELRRTPDSIIYTYHWAIKVKKANEVE